MGYRIQGLDGYTEGRPSWRTVATAHSKEEAERRAAEIKDAHPTMILRIRKRPKKGR